MTIKKAVVTLEKGVNKSSFISEMQSSGNKGEHLPQRAVELKDILQGSNRNIQFWMTATEVVELRKDPRVMWVRYGTNLENGIEFSVNGSVPPRDFSRQSPVVLDSNESNWGIPSAQFHENPYFLNGFRTVDITNYQHSFFNGGEGVDLVIHDDSCEVGHPEWLDPDTGATRLQLIDWPTEANMPSSTQDPNHYSTQPNTSGHGVHVMGTAGGKNYGWAKKANLYFLNILSDVGFDVGESLSLLRNWHLNKGNSRPTVVNMSWGSGTNYSTLAPIISGSFRGDAWDINDFGANESQELIVRYILRDYQSDPSHGVLNMDIYAEIEDCIDAGIIIVSAAGNNSHMADVPLGPDYNNYYTRDFLGILNENIYYNRGSTPSAVPGVICVGNIDSQPDTWFSTNKDTKHFSSTTGPRVDIWAAGTDVMSAIPAGSIQENFYGSANHPDNASFRATKITGTSMASPQVAGVMCEIMSENPTFSPSLARTALFSSFIVQGELADLDPINFAYTIDFFYSLLRGPNVRLYNRYKSTTPFSVNLGRASSTSTRFVTTQAAQI